MIAMAFFTGIDGFDTWNWSGTGSHQAVSLRRRGVDKDSLDVMIGKPFSAKAENGVEESFKRYDVIHLLAVDNTAGSVRFQKIRPKGKNFGYDPQYPVFVMAQDKLLPLLRPSSEPVGAMVEGMALAKPLEYILRHGEVKIDVPAQEQFAKTLPIVRRVKLGKLNVLITYDPMVIHGGQPREIVLAGFDGVAGRTLRLPADDQTRIFVLREQ